MGTPVNLQKYLKKNPLRLLSEKSPLPIRLRTVRQFFPENREMLHQLSVEMEHSKPMQQLIRSQKPDGLWDIDQQFNIEERQKAMIFLQQLKNMYQLDYYGCTKEMPVVRKGIIAMLKAQKPDGKFPLLLHHHGLALLLLENFGLQGNPFVEKGFRWITKRQRHDGGWLSPSMVPDGESLKTAKSDLWTTMIIFQAFANHTRLNNSEHCTSAMNFILDNYLLPGNTSLFPEQAAWNHLATGFDNNGMFRGGTLRFLEAFAPIPGTHSLPKFQKALDWLMSTQLESGLFPAIAGKDQRGDYDVTLRVLQLIAKLESTTEEPNLK